MPEGPAADEKKIQVKRDKSKLKSLQWDSDLEKVMLAPWGRRVLFGILAQTGLYQSSVVVRTDGAPIDTAMTTFRDGRRNMGIWLEYELQRVDPELWLEMHRERLAEPKEE